MKPKTMTHSHFNWLFLLGIVFMLGCNRGCTTKSVIGEEIRTVHYKGHTAQAAVRWIEIRYSRRRPGRGLLERNVSYNYALEYNLKLPKLGIKELDEVPYPSGDDEPDYDREFARFDFELAPDGKHAAYGLEGQVKGVFHEMNGHFFESNYNELWKEKSFSMIDWSQVASPRDLFAESITTGLNCMMNMDHEAELILSELPIDDSIQFLLLESWPDCRNAVNYLNQAMVQRLGQNPAWKAAALDRAREIVLGHGGFIHEDEALQMMTWLEDDAGYDVIDSTQVENFGRSNHRAETYVFEGLEAAKSGQGRPLSDQATAMLLRRVDRASKVFLRSGSERDIGVEEMLRVWALTGSEAAREAFITDIFRVDLWRDEFYVMRRNFLDDQNEFSEAEEKIISEGTLRIFPKVKSYHRADMFEAMRDDVPCGELDRLLTKYSSDLEDQTLPGRCE